MDRVAYWRQFHEAIEEYDLLRHPFYQAWRNGELTREDLREYAADYYHHVAAFPGYLAQCAASLPDGELRESILRNLHEETGAGGSEDRAHHLLWLDFAAAAGATVDEVSSHTPIPEVVALIQTFDQLATSGKPWQALAAFYAYESQVPRVAHEKAKTLTERYGFNAAGCRYFTLHTTADVLHSEVWQEQLDQILESDSEAGSESILAAKLSAKALWNALDGINNRRLSRASSASYAVA